jgi:hypothetical protein
MCEMRGNIGVGVKAVDHVEKLRHDGCLYGEVGRASAAKDHNVDLILHFRRLVRVVNGDAIGEDANGFGISSCENGLQLHIGVLSERAFHASAEIAVAENANFYAHMIISFYENKVYEIYFIIRREVCQEDFLLQRKERFTFFAKKKKFPTEYDG